VRYGSPRTL